MSMYMQITGAQPYRFTKPYQEKNKKKQTADYKCSELKQKKERSLI